MIQQNSLISTGDAGRVNGVGERASGLEPTKTTLVTDRKKAYKLVTVGSTETRTRVKICTLADFEATWGPMGGGVERGWG